MGYLIEPMRVEDIPRVLEIERQSFTSAWPAEGYRREITENRLARYLVLREVVGQAPPRASRGTPLLTQLQQLISGHPGPGRGVIVGYLGIWLMIDQAHITTIAVDPARRGQGLGELLLLTAIDVAIELGGSELTLEVRESNVVAQRMYDKLGFTVAGRRRRYYDTPTEDAILMTSQRLDSPACQRLVSQVRLENDSRVGPVRRALAGA